MKRHFIFAALLACSATFFGQESTNDNYQFTTVDSVGITPVKDQNQSGTCWSFSSISLLESELIRLGKGEFDLSATKNTGPRPTFYHTDRLRITF